MVPLGAVFHVAHNAWYDVELHHNPAQDSSGFAQLTCPFFIYYFPVSSPLSLPWYLCFYCAVCCLVDPGSRQSDEFACVTVNVLVANSAVDRCVLVETC